jgi:hypothetical protein
MAGHHLENLPSVPSKFTQNICEVLIPQFCDRYIQVSEGNALQEIIASLESFSEMPYMWGAIDETHIHLTKQPSEKQVPANYFSRLRVYSQYKEPA